MFQFTCYSTLIFSILITFQKFSNIYNKNLIVENSEEFGLYFEGDIKHFKRNGISSYQVKWPRGIIPYRIEGDFTSTERNILNQAIHDYQNRTCIRFRKYSRERDYLIITNKPSGCWSNVGRIGGRQEMNLESRKCFQQYGTVLHELMHVLGFYHEQNRYERDRYVRIIKQNILPDKLKNFEKLSYNAANSYGISYDYASIMHYRSNSFTRNGQITLKALMLTADAKRMGQRDGFSKKDLKKINAMYSC